MFYKAKKLRMLFMKQKIPGLAMLFWNKNAWLTYVLKE